MSPPPPALENIPNFRDVGAAINKFAGKPLLREGVLFRSGRLDSATATDLTTLSTHHHIHTVLDLRTSSEHARLPSPPPTPWTTHRISLISRTLQFHFLSLLPLYLRIYTLLLLLFGFRSTAHRILGERVLTPLGLAGICVASLKLCKLEIREVLERVASAEGAVLVHCTQGKDRTGVTAMLVAWVCGVETELVGREYALSDGEYNYTGWKTGKEDKGVEREIGVEVREVGLGEEFMGANAVVVERVWEEVVREGGLEKYLDKVGFGEEGRRRLRAKMMV